ncbi:hypothetical protein D777_02029 [Marinobacter nitratireducens]|uniref:Methyltransferase domain-containing protein n=1 Tax=Marinobacter nitratireducens TaxID=1137280 RepID=A0A072NF24_9GAMM|nr:hypothetical protein D777_02029 [Marinobacter nitratireducens]
MTRSDDLLWQVGKTVNGNVVGEDQIELIIERICTALNLRADDRVLDVGAGNGLLTSIVAGRCARVTGVERNQALYERALRANTCGNASYVCQSLSALDCSSLDFNKAFLYEVVQHLDFSETASFIESVFKQLPDSGAVFLGGIPSELQKWSFYGTDERRKQYFRGLAKGTDVMGTWYHPEFFGCLAEDLQLECQVLVQDSRLYTSSYRFDCLLKKRAL